MFKDVGAIGFASRRQWFAERGGGSSIDPAAFENVKATFGFHDAVLLDRAPQPFRGIVSFFSTTIVRDPGDGSPPLNRSPRETLAHVAPIAREFVDLRAERMDGDERSELLGDFAARLADASLLDTGGLSCPMSNYSEIERRLLEREKPEERNWKCGEQQADAEAES
jgi:hypothetical protein